MIVEICASSFTSAYNAEQAGVHRIELCSELAVGGITPSYGLIKQVSEALSIPFFVLIRPRSGDFTYSNEEFEIMKKDIKLCRELGCSGIVSGILNADFSIDVLRTQELVELSKPLPFVFHRAFDWVPDTHKALNSLIDMGVHRVLTSGQEATALKGLINLKKLQEQSNGGITILPGGGITLENALTFKDAGFKEIHCSLSTFNRTISSPNIPMNSKAHFDETKIAMSDTDKIKALLRLLN
ncbi:copper homeostasis protein CutC [Yeosuana marina]|uniref:copper homeostasis protein CutC n=1 Tax=Yeosuana marina TaxID=1565536 RepID=UPI0030C8B434